MFLLRISLVRFFRLSLSPHLRRKHGEEKREEVFFGRLLSAPLPTLARPFRFPLRRRLRCRPGAPLVVARLVVSTQEEDGRL